MKNILTTSVHSALLTISLIASPIASANWCTGKDFYLIDMELADRLIKAQETIQKKQKAIHRTQLQLQYDDTASAEALKQQLFNSVSTLQTQTQKQCQQNSAKQTDLRLQVTQLIHYKQLYKQLDKALKTHKTIGKELTQANDELQTAYLALQAPNQSPSRALNTLSSACLTVSYSQKVVDKFQTIDIETIKKSQHNLDDLQAVMEQYQLLSLPSNTLCDSFTKFHLGNEKNKTSWWKRLNKKVKDIF